MTQPDAEEAAAEMTPRPRGPWHQELARPFAQNEIASKPRIWCYKCRENKTSRVCADHQQIRCAVCKQKITNAHIHLTYVGHAEITRRLLEVDPEWTWFPAYRNVDKDALMAAIATGKSEIVDAVIANSPPLTDAYGGMWITLAIHDDEGRVHEMLGYGDHEDKAPGPAATKEVIGDALRNAGMRRGMALDLWSRSDRALEATGQLQEAEPEQSNAGRAKPAQQPARPARAQRSTPTNGEAVVKAQELANKAEQLARQYIELRKAGKMQRSLEDCLKELRAETHTPAQKGQLLQTECYSKFTGEQATVAVIIGEARVRMQQADAEASGGEGA